MSDIQTPSVNHVACEACRLKKCKCNRILPVCGQCEKSGAQCTYPQAFKRGFPEGYLAAIEARLVQTERALFESLSSLSGFSLHEDSSTSIDNVFNAKQTKSARIEEWERSPLTTVQDRSAWFQEKANKAGPGLRIRARRYEEDPMTEMNSPHSIQGFGNGSTGLPTTTTSWPQSPVHAAGLLVVSQDPSDHFPQQEQRTPGSRLPAIPSLQTESSVRPSSASGVVGTTPQDAQTPSRADILSSRQSRRFF